jgi:hypothetical protein
MQKLLDPYMHTKIKGTKWMDIPKLLRVNQVQMVGLPTVDEFLLLGSLLGDKYCTLHWNKMYEAFTHPNGCAIHLQELPEPNVDSDEATVPIMVDHLGCTQHTIGSVDCAKASNNWSKGAVMGGEGVDHPAVGKGWEGSVRGTGTGGKRQ